MPSLLRVYPILEASRDMREYAGIREDLLQALKYIEVVEAQIAAQSRQLVVWEGITSAAAIAYGRCFKRSEARRRLPKDFLSTAPAEVRETHDYVIAVRDKHIAHSENSFEENYLVAELAFEDGAPYRVEEASVFSRRLIGFSDSDIPALRSLFEWVLNEVTLLYESQKQLVLSELRARRPAEIATFRAEPTPLFLQPNTHATTRAR